LCAFRVAFLPEPSLSQHWPRAKRPVGRKPRRSWATHLERVRTLRDTTSAGIDFSEVRFPAATFVMFAEALSMARRHTLSRAAA
jgi:hypothetical protein